IYSVLEQCRRSSVCETPLRDQYSFDCNFSVLACVLGCTCRDKPSWRGHSCDTGDNQRSSGVVIARSRSFGALDHQRRDLHFNRLTLPLGRSGLILYHIVNMNKEICDRVIAVCEDYGIKELMGFRYNWNTEIITQFHASFYFSNSDSTMHWTTDGIHFAIDIRTFARLLGLGSEDLKRDKIHDEQQLSTFGIQDLYRDTSLSNGGT